MRRASSSADRPVREPVIERREYARRRRRLLEDAGRRLRDHRARRPGGAPQPRYRVPLPAPAATSSISRGFPEPDAAALLLPGRGAGEYRSSAAEHDPHEERMRGPSAGLEGRLWPIRRGRRVSHRRHRRDPAPPPRGPPAHLVLDGRVPRVRRAGARLARAASLRPADPSELVDLHPRVHEMRLYKSRARCAMIRRAVELTERAHRRAMAACRPGLAEYEVEAEILYELHRTGCRTLAYPCIVAAGANACRPHYTRELRDPSRGRPRAGGRGSGSTGATPPT